MPAPRLRGTLHLPADKSIAHRALLFTAMGHGTATVAMHRPGADVRSTIAALAALGALTTQSTGDDGALRAVVRARDEGLTTPLGITGHTHAAPSVHLEALRRFDFDSVLTPWNFRLGQDPAFRADFEQLVAEVQARDVALMPITAVARRNWYPGEKSYDTWYRPFDRQEEVTAAIAWVLAHPAISGVATAGATSLLRLAIRAERDRATMTEARIAEVLGRVPDYSSPFDERMPAI